MRFASVFIIVLTVLAGTLRAQPASPQLRPGRSLEMSAPQEVYKDSAEFAKVFKELFPIVGPKRTVTEDAKEHLARISRSFAMQGIDSAKADSVALIGLDPNAYSKIYFNVYRKNFTATELKKFLEFVKTPEGKKVLAVMPQLERVGPETNSYIAQLIGTNLIPLRQQARERMERERPPSQRGKVPAPIGGPGTPGAPPAPPTPPPPEPAH